MGVMESFGTIWGCLAELAMAEPCGGINEGGSSHRRSAEPGAMKQEGCGGLGVRGAELFPSCSCSRGVCTSRTSCTSLLPSTSLSFFGAGEAPPAPCTSQELRGRAHTRVPVVRHTYEWFSCRDVAMASGTVGNPQRGHRGASGPCQGRKSNRTEGHARRPGRLK